MQIEVQGIVQGVGFRPFVYTLARKHGLGGEVFNDSRGVRIEIEGEEQALRDFLEALQAQPPPLAHIDGIRFRNHLPPTGTGIFSIRESSPIDERRALIPPDAATCRDCMEELFSPSDRRYRYPFINCTNCGPRFTIVEGIPYDRHLTTMRGFRMCADCRREYSNPADRRFHAQPNACSACGPHVYGVAGGASPCAALDSDAIAEALSRLGKGQIVAIKGLGGFHLACDACDKNAVATLRRQKHREEKPFALMARDVAMVRRFCRVDPAEEALLHSESRPIVLLRKLADGTLPEEVAANQKYLGFMLPYTPLHHLLLAGSSQPLVMTSGNLSDEPIAFRDEDALERLRVIADYFLMHDREICIRTDDSVLRAFQERPYPIRRSRGYVPHPIRLDFEFERQILACGAELKNTFALARGREVFVSQHIGDLENLETLESFQRGIEHFRMLFDLRPEAVAYDLHPEYLSTKYALALEDVSLKVGVQHHHAHVAACMAENNLVGDVLGVAFDGLGYGADGRLWGSEFLHASLAGFERAAHLEYLPMPGGVQAIRQPWRMACVCLQQAFGEGFMDLDLHFVRRLDSRRWQALSQMIARGVNCPQTSSMGRLFDAVSALLGLGDEVSYEGQAAVRLEMTADEDEMASYEFGFGGDGGAILVSPLVRSIVADLQNNVALSQIASHFHNAVADLIGRVANRMRRERGLDRVVLSGGVFQNVLLLERTCRVLEALGLDVYVHRQVPANDGGIALGQAVVAAVKMREGRI